MKRHKKDIAPWLDYRKDQHKALTLMGLTIALRAPGLSRAMRKAIRKQIEAVAQRDPAEEHWHARCRVACLLKRAAIWRCAWTYGPSNDLVLAEARQYIAMARAHNRVSMKV